MRTKSRRGWNGAHYIEQVMDDEEEEGQEGSREEEWLRNWAPLAADYGNYDPLRAGSIDGTGTLPHDRGIIRAMKSNYKPSRDPTSQPECTVFVGRINHDTTEDTLKSIFSECGTIKSLRLVRDIVTQRSKGYAFIEYSCTEEAEKAYDKCHRMNVDGYQLIVEFECGRTLPGWVPRRLGGGFGGKKESGQLRFGGRDRPFRKPIVVGSKMLGSGGRERKRSDDSRGEWRRDRDMEWRGRERIRDRRSSGYRERSPRRREGRSRSPRPRY